MNKYDLVLDIIEHPDKYSDEDLANILSDKETAEIYEAVALTASSVKSDADQPNVKTEWLRFKKQNNFTGVRHFRRSGTRAASLGLLIVSSLAALAIGISVSIGFIGNKSPEVYKENKMQNELLTATLDTGTDSFIPNDSTVNPTPILYEDTPLREILDEICRIYKYPIKYGSESAPGLRLYFRLDPSASLQETLDRLNMFDSFDISLEGDTIKVK